jgi:hypothetical protein
MENGRELFVDEAIPGRTARHFDTNGTFPQKRANNTDLECLLFSREQAVLPIIIHKRQMFAADGAGLGLRVTPHGAGTFLRLLSSHEK